jgi:hypothetical protein
MPSTRRIGGGVLLPEQTAPGTPASGYVEVYAKTDGILYYKNDAGTEVAVLASGAPTYPLLAPAGTNTNPSYSFSTDIDTGVYLNGVGDIRIVAAGQSRVAATDDGTNGSTILNARGTGLVKFQHSGVDRFVVAPSATAAAITTITSGVANDYMTKWMVAGDTNYRFRADGDNLWMWGNGTTAYNHTFQVTQSGAHWDFSGAGRVATFLDAQLRVDNTNLPGAPEYSFDTDSDTGMYRAGVNALGLATGGTARLTIDTASIMAALPVRYTEAAAPATPAAATVVTYAKTDGRMYSKDDAGRESVLNNDDAETMMWMTRV